MKKIEQFVAILMIATWANPAMARPEVDDLAGRVIGEMNGRQVELPLLRSDYDIDIQGDLATVTLTQVYENPYRDPMTAEYLFPLNQKAAVYGMSMEIGDETVRAVIKKKAAAEETFENAKSEGKAAALLTQHRPNMFTQRIANLMPGVPVTVRLSYVQPVPRIDGAYELVVPLVVGPRYEGIPDTEGDFEQPVTGSWSVDPLPAYPLVAGLDLPNEIAPDRVGLDLRLASAVPVVSLSSATHDLALFDEDHGTAAAFASGRVIDNRDLVVRYVLGGEDVTAGVLTHQDDRGGFLSLLIEPPAQAGVLDPTPREIVFVLDTSGSMGGLPMEASKRFMASALNGLRPDDYFRIIRFSNNATEFASSAVPATNANRRLGLAYVKGLSAGGGTEIDNAIRTAFGARQPDGTLRIVVFLSDGYIGDEATVLETIRRDIGNARIYAFGIGSSVNRYLLEGMAEEGRGYARYVDPTESAHEAAEGLAEDLRSPVLTDISVDWGDIKVNDVSPSRIPDLFEGRQLRLLARHSGGTGQIRLNGLVAGRRATLLVDVEQTEGGVGSEAIPLIWARGRVADHERAIAVRDGDAKAHEDAITRLGLRFGLQTRFTSFVAVYDRVVNPTGVSKDAAVPLPQVAGVPPSAYPTFSGSSAPEPETLFGILVLAVAATAAWGRRRAKMAG